MRISRRSFNTLIIGLIAIILAGAGFLVARRFRQPAGTPVAAVTPVLPDAQAAMAGVSAFYTIDYTETSDQWLQRLCSTLATGQDCAVEKMLIAPRIYSLAQQYRIQTTSSVFPVRMVSTRAGTDGSELRVWELQVTLSQPWPGEASPMSVYADVVMNPANHAWSMRHILFEQEVQALQTAAP
jgi:hypothetical protein